MAPLGHNELNIGYQDNSPSDGYQGINTTAELLVKFQSNMDILASNLPAPTLPQTWGPSQHKDAVLPQYEFPS